MSFGRPSSASSTRSGHGGSPKPAVRAAQFVPRPGSASASSRASSGRTDSSKQSSGSTKWEMSTEEFKRQVQNQFAVVLSWDEVRALQRLYGEPDSGVIDFMKFAVALGKSPGHGPEKCRRAYNFLPKHTTEYDLNAIEKKIMHKLEDRCEVAGNYQYQWARRILCDPTSTLAGGMEKEQLKLRLSGLLGVELSDGEMNVLFRKYADPATGRVHMQSFATRLLEPDYNGHGNGWFLLDNQMREKIVTNRISPSSRYHHRPGVDTYKPLCHAFPQSLKGFKWDMGKLVAKLKVKLREHARGIAGYQFLAGCKLFRSEVPPSRRKGDRISAEDFRRVVEYRFGMKLDPDEVLALFHFLVPGTGESVEIAAMVRVLEPDDYTDSWFNTRESTDMFGFTKPGPEKVVLQAKKMNVGGSWNLDLIEDKLREKIHERVGGTSLFEVQAAYSLFQDGRNNGLTKKGFKERMHDKFAVVLSDKDVNDVFRKYDPKGTGKLDVHSFVVRLVSPEAEPEPWFRGRDTYEFHVLNRAPMKKDPMKADCWNRANWTFRHFEETLRDKLLAKSNQDGGRFAFKSAVNLLRSANPDHLDSSHMDREALKFIVFRRFDIVMDDHLLDQIFARFDPECSGKMPVHRLVQHLLPAKDTGSHHLVPKTDGQGQATKTLLGKIFGMTGKRREMISLNGSGVEDPQGESLLERMAAGDKGNGEKIKSELARKAKAAATAAAAAEVAAAEAARNGPKITPAALAAAAARRRDSSPLVFSGDVSPGPAGKEAMIRAAAVAARPETTSTNSGESSVEAGGCGRGCRRRTGGQVRSSSSSRGGGEEERRGEEPRRGLGSSCGEPPSLLEREGRLHAREMAVRQQEETMRMMAEMINNGDSGGVPPTTVVTTSADRVGMAGGEATVSPRPPRRERDRPASASALRRHAGNRRQQQNRPGSRPASPTQRETANNNNSGRSRNRNKARPSTALSGDSRSSIVARRAKQEEAALIARCRALGTAQRKAAAAAVQRRKEVEKGKLDREVPQAIRTAQDGSSRCSGASTDAGTRRALPTTVSSSFPPSERRAEREATTGGDGTVVGAQHNRSCGDKEAGRIDIDRIAAVGCPPASDRAAETRAKAVGSPVAPRAPSRPQSAAAAHRQIPCPRGNTSTRPRSASTSRSVGIRGENTTRGEPWGRGTGRETESGKVESEPESADREEYSGRGAAAHRPSCRPASAGLPVGDPEHERYRERLNSAHALQMRAMQRLQKRRAQSAHKRSPERPPSGGCEGVCVGQFKSRYSGLDRFVLARSGEGTAAVQAGASRFGSGVPFYG